ncbi:MAG: glutamine--fructose-6-phosphate transaminase (isomerizing) [Proteobacteria bacterium]|nr:glutamine--fructose-6-phosphate transaminase (isomerizing) [Pseudomonadota bacterium]NOG59131.1 glutamine--fructose-6-phosphate transaminase (isomerizing) [Pseudomonadota bacterium]
MCGIVGAIAQRDVSPVLLEGLKRLEYRGYDSAGLAVVDHNKQLQRIRVLGKVNELQEQHQSSPLQGGTGIAHTRWATHGKPSLDNAHPHICRNQVALVHNGIIENHEQLRAQQVDAGYDFSSETDTEVVVNAVYEALQTTKELLQAVFRTIEQLEGAYALGVINKDEPERLIAARKGSPLVIGVGIGEYFIASDVFALLPVTQQFIFLEEGDVADIKRDKLTIYDSNQQIVERPINVSELSSDVADKAGYRHYMLKEIFSQPNAIAESLENRIEDGRVVTSEFGQNAESIFQQVKSVKIVACGTSYHAGLIAAHWLEEIAQIPCQVEIASEYRYRKSVVVDNTLFVSISQSGETADTLAALQLAKKSGFLNTLAICNVAESSLTREAELVFLTHAGPEIGVASTKAFTTQLVGLFLLVIAIAKQNGLDSKQEAMFVKQLESLPGRVNQLLQYKDDIENIAKDFSDKHHALFLGRGSFLPVAMEGALKLKEISYIHAEAYAAGELKHGPLALVDDDMPVVAVAPNNNLLEKLKSNLQEVQARGGKLYLFADKTSEVESTDGVYVLKINALYDFMAPILYTIPLQLLAYYVAVIKGADIDQPRNLAKSVTVE